LGWLGIQLCAVYFAYLWKEWQNTFEKNSNKSKWYVYYGRKGLISGAVFMATSLPIDAYYDLLFGVSCKEVGKDVWECFDTPVLN
jgi:hypothetical protein